MEIYKIKIYFGLKPIIVVCVCFLMLSGCKKYLDAKPDQKLVTPTNVQSLQGLLDYYSYMNRTCSDAGEIAADNYYLTNDDYFALFTDRERAAYLWKPGVFNGQTVSDWQQYYNVIYQCNVVLENLTNIERTTVNSSSWDVCAASALVFRAKSFYEVSQIWAKAYDSATANVDQGIPLRLTSDFNERTVRANLKNTYNQIINDLNTAIPLLPNTPDFVFRPSKPAAYALLARTYLIMRNYGKSFLYADSCLQISSNLVDFNSLISTTTYPFSRIRYVNPEDIMHSIMNTENSNLYSGKIDSVLYRSYASNDLRKTIYYKLNADGLPFFRGSYDGASFYNGIAKDEVLLMRAECFARQGNTIAAMRDLDTLLIKRYRTGTFAPTIATGPVDALNKVLSERRKELVYRGIRFSDIKRLNKEGANITQQRIINNQAYFLTPNDGRYALPIPDKVIEFSGIPQN